MSFTLSPSIGGTRRVLALLAVLAVAAVGLARAPLAEASHFQFPDVPRSHFAFPAVDWGVHQRITGGVGDTGHFFPARDITRAELVTMLWRAAGTPPSSGRLPADVPANHFGAPAVRWALQQGITTGIGDTGLFGPERPITRAEIITMMWRSEGRPPSSGHLLRDVPADHWSATATRWAWDEGISYGVGRTRTFQPHRNLTRAEAITFIYRLETGAKAPNPFYEFYGVGPDGVPWKWNGCAPIYYHVDYSRADKHTNARRVVPEAIRQLHEATGLTFIPTDDPSAALRIRWATAADDDEFAENRRVAGYADFQAVQRGNRVRIERAVVVINGDFNVGSQDFGGPNSLGTLLLHELGHAVGLAHVHDAPSEVMYPVITPHATYQAGDRNGLRIVGTQTGCAVAAGGETTSDLDELEGEWHRQH